MSKIGIVVVGYNRVDSMKRLMKSLFEANYSEIVDLIISIDNSGTNKVEKYAETIIWPHGKKIIKTFPNRLGLRNHVLTCGNYINEFGFDAIVVLEDDVFVAPGFFDFVRQSIEKYKFDNNIAGISLYAHSWNLNADRPFIPVHKGYDVFYMQYPQSWGQVWMKNQWNAFYKWYEQKKYENIDENYVPDNVLRWPDTSWLKYHIEYCIDTNKYFVYPYYSLTTNYADAGTHYTSNTNKMQIPLDMSINKKYLFPDNIKDSSIYDAYYENTQLAEALNIKSEELEVDLYGMKKEYSKNSKYLLTTKPMKLKVIKAFGLQMRPWELNVFFNVLGNEIFLYDLNKNDKMNKIKHFSLMHWKYDTRGEIILKRNFVDIIFNEIYNKMKYVIKAKKSNKGRKNS